MPNTCMHFMSFISMQSLLGNKYGNEEISEWLTLDEMEELKKAACTYDQSHLLTECYSLDNNSLPPAYRLKVNNICTLKFSSL